MVRWALCANLLFVVMVVTAAKGKGNSGKRGRRGDEGQSGQRCIICQACVFEARKAWARARTTKTGSPYNYLDNGPMGTSLEELVLDIVKKKVCNKLFLSELPNPKGYAKHVPTVQYECDNVLEEHGSNIVDALTLGDEVASFCWEADICGDADALEYDLKSDEL
mmetsp:Transcript_97348/g.272429  ORF Transcript_97348/g.272429 Transcript_97348/m.272429 type:complete len:165 (-) Transcript_97348:61-555(-)